MVSTTPSTAELVFNPTAPVCPEHRRPGKEHENNWSSIMCSFFNLFSIELKQKEADHDPNWLSVSHEILPLEPHEIVVLDVRAQMRWHRTP